MMVFFFLLNDFMLSLRRVQSKNQVMMMIDPEECREPSHSTRSIPVALYVVDEFGGYDKSLVDEMKSLLEDDTVANNTLAVSRKLSSVLSEMPKMYRISLFSEKYNFLCRS